MTEKLKILKEDIMNFVKTCGSPIEWTPEKYTEINEMMTMTEKEFNGLEKECESVLEGIGELRKVFVDIRKSYFDTHEGEKNER